MLRGHSMKATTQFSVELLVGFCSASGRMGVNAREGQGPLPQRSWCALPSGILAVEKLVCSPGMDQTRDEKCHCAPPVDTRVLNGDCWQDFRSVCGGVRAAAPDRTRLVALGRNKLMSSSEGQACIVPML